MRVNKNTHSFRPVMTENSYKKSDRVYPESKSFQQLKQQRRAMIAERNMQDVQEIPVIHRTLNKTLILNSSEYKERRYLLQCRQAVAIHQPNDGIFIDDTCFWNLDLANPIFNKSKRSIQINKASLIVSQYTGQNYPLLVYICMDNITGFFNNQNKLTNRIAVMELAQISPVYERNGIQNYDLRYQTKSSYQWPIPVGIKDVNLRAQYANSGDEFIKLPLINPIVIDLTVKNE